MTFSSSRIARISASRDEERFFADDFSGSAARTATFLRFFTPIGSASADAGTTLISRASAISSGFLVDFEGAATRGSRWTTGFLSDRTSAFLRGIGTLTVGLGLVAVDPALAACTLVD